MEDLKGAFVASLQRNNRQLRDDRARAISEDTELSYRRTIEDIDRRIKSLQRDQESMLDLGHTSKDTIIAVSDFKTETFVEKDIQLSVAMRQEQIRLEEAKKRYAYLFGGD